MRRHGGFSRATIQADRSAGRRRTDDWRIPVAPQRLVRKHKHGDTEHETDLKTDAHGYRQAQCRDCEATLADRRGDTEERAKSGR